MNTPITTQHYEADELLNDTLRTAQTVISFYEERLDSALELNDFLEKENARLQSLLNTYLNTLPPRRPSGGPFGGLPE